jgi:hypothetical protein
MVTRVLGLVLLLLIYIYILILTMLNDILNIVKGGVPMAIEVLPEWIVNLEDEDVVFIKKFLQASGSLKEVAKQYGVTYPTVRLRLDRLIQKIQISEDTNNEPYIALIKRLAVNEKIDFDTAKILISEYKKSKREVR